MKKRDLRIAEPTRQKIKLIGTIFPTDESLDMLYRDAATIAFQYNSKIKEEGKSEYTFKIMDMVLSQVDSLESLEKQLVEVVTKSVNKIIGDLDEKDRIVRVVRKGLSAVRGEKRIVVRVSTHDEPIVREDLKAYLLSDDGRSGYIEVIGDVNLKKGDCILETQMGVVEASLDTQLKILSESLSARVASKD